MPLWLIDRDCFGIGLSLSLLIFLLDKQRERQKERKRETERETEKKRERVREQSRKKQGKKEGRKGIFTRETPVAGPGPRPKADLVNCFSGCCWSTF